MGAGVCRSLGEKHQGYAGKQEARWPVIFVGEGIVNGHWLLSRKVKYLSHLAKHKGRGIAIVLAIVETLEEERLSYLRSLQGHAAVEYGELRSAVPLKAGVGDHTAERFADHEPCRNANHAPI